MIENLLDMVKNKNIFTFCDVGTMGGIPKKWEFYSGLMKIIAFEPDRREYQKLSNNDCCTNFNFVLHNRSEDLVFHISKAHGKSSIYPSNSIILRNYPCSGDYEEERIENISKNNVTTLDKILLKNNIRDIDFLKIDTQGSELRILEGSKKFLLNKIFGIQMEVEFLELYENQPLFRDVDKFLCNMEFNLIDLRRQYWKRNKSLNFKGRGQLIFGDALYFRSIDNFKNTLAEIKDHQYILNKIYKAIAICLIYGMFDYAVALISFCKELIPAEKDKFIIVEKEIFKRLKHSFLIDFKGKNIIYKLLLKITNIFKPNSYLGYADSDSTIANVLDI